MIHRSHQADNITMSGGGLYSLATKGAKDVIDLATPQVLSAVRESPLGAASYWCFSDLGCADGGTSLDLWRSVITAVRQRSDADIQIVYKRHLIRTTMFWPTKRTDRTRNRGEDVAARTRNDTSGER